MKNWKELKKQFWAKLIAIRNRIRVAGKPEHGGKRH